jgi:predicted SnoaL-like aldol condensation-catalyzing enzyme
MRSAELDGRGGARLFLRGSHLTASASSISRESLRDTSEQASRMRPGAVDIGWQGPEISPSLPKRGARPMSVEENKALVRRYFESGYREAMRGNLDVVHQYFADHYHDHTSLHPEHPGLEGMKELLSDSGQATPDLRREIVDIAARDDLVFVHWRATATHEGQHQVHKQSG